MAEHEKKRRPRSPRRYFRIAAFTVLGMMALSMLLPLTGYLYVGVQEASAQAVQDTNPRSNYWRAVREGASGYSAVKGQESGVLIHDGNNWRQIRNGWVANYGAWFLFGVLVAIMLFFAVRGSVKVDGGPSGVKVKRWNVVERCVHWCTASLFVVMAVTGLSLLFGRQVLIPVLGGKGFAAWANIAMTLHNYLGPVLALGVFLMIVMWIRHNIPNGADLKWFLTGGGLIGKGHPDAGFANGGEKAWFWLICTAGVAVIVSGFVLNFPNYGFTRDQMQLANLVHGVLSMVWIAVWLGHAYIGSIGSEGSLEGMTTGYVDERWARQHHNVWVGELEQKGQMPAAASGDDAPQAGSGAATAGAD
jgi:formate dehydrogenase subunit gamma